MSYFLFILNFGLQTKILTTFLVLVGDVANFGQDGQGDYGGQDGHVSHHHHGPLSLEERTILWEISLIKCDQR